MKSLKKFIIGILVKWGDIMGKKLVIKKCQIDDFLDELGHKHVEECLSCRFQAANFDDCFLGQWIDGVGWLCGDCWELTNEFIQAGCRR